ncbi:hypothetical protein XENOCAPTIV_025324 [Xenoophorus captivus]|uniref:Formin FH3 domain-containing protein n=1 Tax=Xenoophorus captivus TaxID=1517983 RepID=A0ABV0QLY4_9TELE
MVKMQVFELLAALALFDPRGCHLTLDAFENYKSLKKQQYRFSVIMNELQTTDNIPYMVALMATINVLILGQEDLRKRHRMRHEFIETEDMDLNIQCDAFEDSMADDEEEMERLYGGIDMSSHQEVFTSLFTKGMLLGVVMVTNQGRILGWMWMVHPSDLLSNCAFEHLCGQVSSWPSSVQLLSILQALVMVDPKRADVWLALEKLTDRATLLAQEHSVAPDYCSIEQLFSLPPTETGTHTGNADGFKIGTLLRLTETKANKSRITLLHHILEVRTREALLMLAKYESLQACEQLQKVMSLVEDRRRDLADYLCEDISSFSLDDLFGTIKTFRGLFLRALKIPAASPSAEPAGEPSETPNLRKSSLTTAAADTAEENQRVITDSLADSGQDGETRGPKGLKAVQLGSEDPAPSKDLNSLEESDFEYIISSEERKIRPENDPKTSPNRSSKTPRIHSSGFDFQQQVVSSEYLPCRSDPEPGLDVPGNFLECFMGNFKSVWRGEQRWIRLHGNRTMCGKNLKNKNSFCDRKGFFSLFSNKSPSLWK